MHPKGRRILDVERAGPSASLPHGIVVVHANVSYKIYFRDTYLTVTMPQMYVIRVCFFRMKIRCRAARSPEYKKDRAMISRLFSFAVDGRSSLRTSWSVNLLNPLQRYFRSRTIKIFFGNLHSHTGHSKKCHLVRVQQRTTCSKQTDDEK